ncbi:MAG TPA: hypothetical protein VEI49_06475 [Terriglobales bacterium]|nr:hypothetical protein [Terriglobales bacterium]
MTRNSRSKTVFMMLLCLSLMATGCKAQWIKVALADLPVLTQMALNIGSLVTTLQSGQQLSSTDAAAIQSISNQAGRDLQLLQTLYNEYQANPSTSVIQKIQNAVADLSQNLPALLQAVHVSDPTLSARVTAAVNLIVTTVDSFAVLIPQPKGAVNAKEVAHKPATVPGPADLKKQWNEQVCAARGVIVDSAQTTCEMK